MPEPNTPRPLDAAGLAVAVFCCALWGGNSVATKFAIADGALPPIGGAALRFVVSLPVVAWVCLRGGTGFAVPRRYWRLLAINGVLTAAQIATFNWGTSRSDAGRSSVFINVHPLVTAPLAWLVLGEHLGARGIAGLLTAAGGVAVILSRQLLRGGGLMGDVVILTSALIFGVQTVVQKLTLPSIPARTLVFAQTLVALPIVGAWGLLAEGFSGYHFTPGSVAGLLYQGLASSGVCFSLWLILLGRYSAGRLATIALLTPLFGVALGVLLRGEPLTTPLVVGGVLVALGVYLVASGKPTGPEPEPEPDWGRKLRRFRLGAEPLADQLASLRATTVVLSGVCGGVALMFLAIFAAFRHPGVGAAFGLVLLGPIVALAWLDYRTLARRVAAYEAGREPAGDQARVPADSG